MSKKQKIAKKRAELCAKIIGKPVRSAFMNGNLPHGVALAFTGAKDASFVNLKKQSFIEYLRDGKFLMKRAYTPIRFRQLLPDEEATAKEFCPSCIGVARYHNQYCLRLKAAAENECPACVNKLIDGEVVRGLTHNQFCDSLKFGGKNDEDLGGKNDEKHTKN